MACRWCKNWDWLAWEFSECQMNQIWSLAFLRITVTWRYYSTDYPSFALLLSNSSWEMKFDILGGFCRCVHHHAMIARLCVHGGKKMKKDGDVFSRPLWGLISYLQASVFPKLPISSSDNMSRLHLCGQFSLYRYHSPPPLLSSSKFEEYS